MKIRRKFKTIIILPFISMADIAFLLLIFLIINSVITPEQKIILDLPESKIFEKANEKINIEFFVTKKGKIFLNGEEISIEEIDSIFAIKKECIISADKDTEFIKIFKLIEKLKQSRYEKIYFKVKRK